MTDTDAEVLAAAVRVGRLQDEAERLASFSPHFQRECRDVTARLIAERTALEQLRRAAHEQAVVQ